MVTASCSERFENVRVETEGGVAVVELARESVLNSFDGRTFLEVAEALEWASECETVSCVLVTGRGRAFSAGSDLNDTDSGAEPYERFIGTLESFRKPLIAAVNGLAVGIGATLLGHCDLVLASPEARFRFPFAALGLVPEAGSTSTFPPLMGPQTTAHAMFTGEWVGAKEAERAGLVWQITEPEQLRDQALKVCSDIAAMPVESLIATKQLLLEARLPAAHAARKREDAEFVRMLQGDAHRAAVEAFRRGTPD